MAASGNQANWLKRPSLGMTAVPSKAPRMDSINAESQDSGEEWSCGKCGNVNFPGRVVCNMRRCQAPKPSERWTCAACGNENFEGRLFCNLRRCGLAKPGLTAEAFARAQPGAMVPGVALGGVPAGSWTCLVCNNVNYPTRTTCNGQNGRCGQPRETADKALIGGHAPPTRAPEIGMGGSMGGMHLAMPMGRPAAKAPQSAPPGSWVCITCQNVNWPTRSTCNGRSCGRPREEVDGGAPSTPPRVSAGGRSDGGAGMGVKGTVSIDEAPDGSWVCQGCQNVNWPGRTSCNKRNCGLPRVS